MGTRIILCGTLGWEKSPAKLGIVFWKEFNNVGDLYPIHPPALARNTGIDLNTDKRCGNCG